MYPQTLKFHHKITVELNAADLSSTYRLKNISLILSKTDILPFMIRRSTCITKYIDIFVEKMREASAHQKLLTFFNKKYWHMLDINV